MTDGPVWYGPDQEWPNHPKPYFRKPLKLARLRGWSLQGVGKAAHIFGTAHCPQDAKAADRHFFPIFTSGRAGESAAKDFEKLVRRCAHLPAHEVSVLVEVDHRLEQIEVLLRAGHKLVDKVEHQHSSDAAWARAEELDAMTSEAADELTALLEEAVSAEQKALDAEEAARRLVGDLPADALPDQIDAEVREVERRLWPIRPSSDLQSLRERLERAKAELSRLRRRLSRV